ncbi:hypothetical protein ACQPW3_25840 [Actinosynnema sp. CA-248983]
MTSIWTRLDVEAKVVEVLATVRSASSPRLGGRPFVTAYQLAILVDGRYPEIRNALGDVPIGGAGSGSRTSLAQYLVGQLATEIRSRGDDYRIAGATLSRAHLGELTFKVPGRDDIRDSNAEAGYDLSLFSLRDGQS